MAAVAMYTMTPLLARLLMNICHTGVGRTEGRAS